MPTTISTPPYRSEAVPIERSVPNSQRPSWHSEQEPSYSSSSTVRPNRSPPSSSGVFPGANNVGVYGLSQFSNARGSIIHIHNQTPYVPEGDAAIQGVNLRMEPSQPYVSPLPGSDTISNPIKTYTRLMMAQGHGYPLWCPKPPDDLPAEYISTGVRVGDVGVVTSDGVFDFAFNVYLPGEHPINIGRVPPNFEPLRPRPSVRIDTERWKEKSRLVSMSISDAIDLEEAHIFDCSGPEGAVLALPTGASREDARDLANLRDYASNNAIGWYQYLISRLGWEIANGSLYLITGCDKTANWGTAAFNSGCHLTFRMVYGPNRSETATSRYLWEDSGRAETNSGQSSSQLGGARNQTVFLRGFKATLQPRFWAQLSYAVEISSISEENDSQLFLRCMWLRPLYFWLLGYFGPHDILKRSSWNPKIDRLEFSTHPPDVINFDMLRRAPNAKLALAHDSMHWSSVIERAHGTPPRPSAILSQVYGEYDIQQSGDVVFLVKKKPPPCDIFDHLKNVWRGAVYGERTLSVLYDDEEPLISESPISLPSPPPSPIVSTLDQHLVPRELEGEESTPSLNDAQPSGVSSIIDTHSPPLSPRLLSPSPSALPSQHMYRETTSLTSESTPLSTTPEFGYTSVTSASTSAGFYIGRVGSSSRAVSSPALRIDPTLWLHNVKRSSEEEDSSTGAEDSDALPAQTQAVEENRVTRDVSSTTLRSLANRPGAFSTVTASPPVVLASTPTLPPATSTPTQASTMRRQARATSRITYQPFGRRGRPQLLGSTGTLARRTPAPGLTPEWMNEPPFSSPPIPSTSVGAYSDLSPGRSEDEVEDRDRDDVFSSSPPASEDEDESDSDDSDGSTGSDSS